MFRFFRLKLRGKLLLVSLVLLLLPWLGGRYIQAVEDLLQQEQAHAMATIAKASAIVVSQYPNVLNQRTSLLEMQSGVMPLNAFSMTNQVRLDGYQDEWLDYKSLLKTFPQTNQLSKRDKIDLQDLSARYLIAQQDSSLVVLLDIVDDSVQFRNPYSPQRHGADAIIVAMIDERKRVHQYILSSSSYGAMNAYEYVGSYLDPVIIQRYTGIKSAWQKSAYGYRVEVKIPLSMLDNTFSVAVIDVDGNKGKEQAIGLGDVRDRNLFSSLFLPSTVLAEGLANMATEGVRVWLVDNESQIIASAGQGVMVMEEPEFDSVLELFYQLFLQQAVSDDESLSHEQSVISGETVEAALNGLAQTERRRKQNSNVMIVASHPVVLDGAIVGAIVAEQNTNAILGLQNQAVKTLLNTTLAVFAVVIFILLAFASRLSFRIRRLNRDVSSVVNGDGRVSGQFSGRVEYDELGELRQGFEQLFGRLGLYTHYLEALASRLAHELRTPIAVIRTSLEHLEQSPENAQVYIDRARSGSERLNNIVARMSEASRLEQTVNTVTLEAFDLNELLVGLLPIYQDLHPSVLMKYTPYSDAVVIMGSQDLIVQMLDKLMSNAIDFHDEGSEVRLALHCAHEHCTLSIRNHGVKLPEELGEQLFQPMVSVRQSAQQSTEPHLGLGLYIVKLIAEIQSGKVSAKNWQNGVEFCVELPITSL